MFSQKQLKGIITAGIIIILLLLAAIGWYYATLTVFAADQTIEGDYQVKPFRTLLLKNGAVLHVTGDLTVDGTIGCDQGGIELVVDGNLHLSKKIECEEKNIETDDISIVVGGAVFIGPQSEIISGGSMQIVDDPSKLALTEQELEAIYDTVEEEDDALRLGPLTENEEGIIEVESTDISKQQPAFIPVAHAQEADERVVIQGNIVIGKGQTPPEKIDARLSEEERQKKIKKIILHFDFSDDKGVALRNLTVKGPAGKAGADAASGCAVRGRDGEDAMRFNGRAGSITIDNFTLELGSGGAGGKGIAADCETASARGGNGGKPGNFKITAARNFQINGSFVIIPGAGGAGGEAIALADIAATDGCPGENGGDAIAVGGNGGDSKQRLSASGNIGGTGNVIIKAAFGGEGGRAEAAAGDAGEGNACGCNGGIGGNATATGGNGGDAISGEKNQGIGGSGGDARAIAGIGGIGGSCKKDEGPAGQGGKGGNAKATPGTGGNGDSSLGDGSVETEEAGFGGDGGNGCFEGKGGKAGTGSVAARDGDDGKRLCSAPKKEDDSLEALLDRFDDPDLIFEDADASIDVIAYEETFIPTWLVRLSAPDQCPEDHWHGHNPMTLKGQTVTDPAPDSCGFGAISETPNQMIDVNLDVLVERLGEVARNYAIPHGTEFQLLNPEPECFDGRTGRPVPCN